MWLNKIKNYFFPRTPTLASTTTPSPWSVNLQEATFITQNWIRDFLWPIFTALGWDYLFRPTKSFLSATLGQLIWTSIGVIATLPLTAYFWHKVYDERYKKSLMYSGIAAFSALYTIAPWNAVAYVGTQFYQNQGLSNTTSSYLGAMIPGPGFAEGPLQVMVTAAANCVLDPKYELNEITYAIGLTPLAYITGDAWMVVYNLLADRAKESTGGLIGQAIAVSSTVAILNYLTLKGTNAFAKLIEKCIHKEFTAANQRPTFFSKSHGTTVYAHSSEVKHRRVPGIT